MAQSRHFPVIKTPLETLDTAELWWSIRRNARHPDPTNTTLMKDVLEFWLKIESFKMFLAAIVSKGVSRFLRWGFIKWQSPEWLMSSADISDNDCNDASDIEIVTDTVRGFLSHGSVLSRHLIIAYSWLSNDWTTPDAGCIKTNLYLAPLNTMSPHR